MTDHDPYGDPTRVERPLADPTQALPLTGGGPPTGGLPPIDEPPPGDDDRRWWILGGLLLLVILVGGAALLLGGGDDDEAIDDTTTTTEATTTTTGPTTSTTTTTEATTTSSTTTTEAPKTTVAPAKCTSGSPDDADSSVQVMYEAFTLDDRDCAEKVATQEAVDQLWAVPGDGGGWEYQGCEEQQLPDPHLSCAYTFPGGATHFRTSYNDIDGWLIFEVFQTTD